jgi:hypothetical protein
MSLGRARCAFRAPQDKHFPWRAKNMTTKHLSIILMALSFIAANLSADKAVDAMASQLKSHGPDPADGATDVVWPRLGWTPGVDAVCHVVYLGETPALGPGDIQDVHSCLPFYYHIPGLPLTTYYWRIDDIGADGHIQTEGDVWRFTTAPRTTSNPHPSDGAKPGRQSWVDLSWTPGFACWWHDVYFGEDLDGVSSDTPGGSTFRGSVTASHFVVGLPGHPYPQGLVPGTTYYWRIDAGEHRGDIWSFTAGGPMKWSQPPIEIDPGLQTAVYCGWDQPSWVRQGPVVPFCTPVVADDFRCLGDVPLTSIHWWGSYVGWDGEQPPNTDRPSAWQLAIWANAPADYTIDFNQPGELLWQCEVRADRVHVESVGIDKFRGTPSDRCFQYYVHLEPHEYLHQGGHLPDTQNDVFWLGIAAVYSSDISVAHPWGWKTRPSTWMGAAVKSRHEFTPGPDPVFDCKWEPLADLRARSYDVTFELGTDPRCVKWEQPFQGIRNWPHYEGERSIAIQEAGGSLSIERLVADDWQCCGMNPVTAVVWWGSYIDYGYKACTPGAGPCYPSCLDDYDEWVAVGQPDCWCHPRQCHGDADGASGGSTKAGVYYVGPADLNLVVSSWLVKESPHGAGIASVPNGICADFAHDQGGSDKTGIYRVGPSDLNILVANWLKKEPPHGPGVSPDCLACAAVPGSAQTPRSPDHFVLSIWTDVPDPNADDPNDYSHPGRKIWEYQAMSYDEVLVGYDKHPEDGEPSEPREPVFRYSVRLPEEAWFHQDGDEERVYWLSVLAVYREAPPYPWSWTNHKHVWNDDAVAVQPATDDPPGWHELHDQTGVSEDMSFMLLSPTARPVTATQCMAVHTQCPAVQTECPPLDTECPYDPTECPSPPSICQLVDTVCPPDPSRCPPVPTACCTPTMSPVACASGGSSRPRGPIMRMLSRFGGTPCPVVDAKCPTVVPEYALAAAPASQDHCD